MWSMSSPFQSKTKTKTNKQTNKTKTKNKKQKTKQNKNQKKNKTLIPCFLGHACIQYYIAIGISGGLSLES